MTQTQHATDLHSSFGSRLRIARETLGIKPKDAATQLCLPEHVILMLEEEQLATDLPTTFLRGYLRAYGNLLQVPKADIATALEQLSPLTSSTHSTPLSLRSLNLETTEHYFMKIFTYLITFVLLSLFATWAYTHYNNLAPPRILALVTEEPAPATTQLAENTLLPVTNTDSVAKILNETLEEKPVKASTKAVAPTRHTIPVAANAAEADIDNDEVDIPE